MTVATAGLDPVTFEVIRHRLWAINDDQARMAARLSGSPIVYEAFDFNAALITADGRGLYTGVYILQHGVTIDEFVRQIRAEWPAEDMDEGDMFFTNDPWSGALHANDGILVMPIVWRGRLVGWSGIVMHDDDVGSPVPGSRVTGATDRFGEAPLLPPVKMVEGFQIRSDVERIYLRNSRTPELNALNMRARVAALRATHRRICELIDEYGAEAFLAAQDGIIDYVERVVRQRLRELPDGTWNAQVHHDHDGNSDRVYTLQCQVTKREDRLTVDFAGTSRQAPGPINCTRPTMEASVVGVILTFLCYDLPWAVGGVRKVLEIRSDEGTINNAVSPAACSMASIMGMLSTQDVVASAVAKMLLCSERYRSEAQATWSAGSTGTFFAAVGPEGDFSLGRPIDPFGGGGGARTFADGIDSGGVMHSMASRIANVETLESRSPLLQVFRLEKCDAGGPGRYRGGVSIEFGALPHKVREYGPSITRASGVAVPVGRGLSGGRPGAAVSNRVLRSSNLRELFDRGFIPTCAEDVGAAEVEIQAAKQLTILGPEDLVVGVVAGGGGYGDPLLRDPERVKRDVTEGSVSEAMARSAYGVVIRDDEVLPDETAALREHIRRTRLAEGRFVGEARVPETEHGGTMLHPVADTVEAMQADTLLFLRCSVCHHRFGDYCDDYKRTSLMRELPLTHASPLNQDCDLDNFVLREYCCPGCGTAVAMDVQHKDDEILSESRLRLPDTV